VSGSVCGGQPEHWRDASRPDRSGHVRAQSTNAGDGPLALLACPSGERHTLGLICFGRVLADRGWRIAYLGTDTPVAEIAGASASLRPDAVVLCSFDAPSLTADAEALAGLGRRHHTILAGRGVTSDLAERLGVHRAAGDPLVTAPSAGARTCAVRHWSRRRGEPRIDGCRTRRGRERRRWQRRLRQRRR